MSAAIGICLVLAGVALVATREWSAELHERWNSRFRWTKWATGPLAMQASRIANVVVGVAFIGVGVVMLLASLD